MLKTMLSPTWQPGYPVDLRSPAMRLRSATGPYGDFELKAARILARTIGLKTVLQDDNRMPGTPDFRIESTSGVLAVGEVVITANPARAEQLRAFARGELRFESQALRCTWWLTIASHADRKRLRKSIVHVLAAMEARGAHQELTARLGPPTRCGPDITPLSDLGVTDVVCDPRPRGGAGLVIGQPSGIEGPVVPDWDGWHAWLEGFLASDTCYRKCDKLSASQAPERHLFIGVTWDQPWSVLRILDRDVRELPRLPPTLPHGITHLWLYGAELPGRCLTFWPDIGWFDVSHRWATA